MHTIEFGRIVRIDRIFKPGWKSQQKPRKWVRDLPPYRYSLYNTTYDISYVTYWYLRLFGTWIPNFVEMPCMLIRNQTATQQNKINSCSVGEPRLWNGRKSRNQRNKQEIVPKICYRIEHGERGITKWEKRLCSIEDINCDSIISNFINYSHQTNDLNVHYQ